MNDRGGCRSRRVRGAVLALVVLAVSFVPIAAVAAQDDPAPVEPARFEDARCPTDDEVAIIEERIDVGGSPAGGDAGIGSEYVYRGPTCVVVERDLEAGLQQRENFQPIRVTLFDPDTGEPAVASYEVFGSVQSATFQDEELYPFAYPFRDDPSRPPGVYRGIVIVPFTGAWTIAVSAFDRVDFDQSGVPTPLGRGEIQLDVVAPTLESAVDIGRISDPPGADIFEVFVLGVHSALGLSWFALAGLASFAAVGPRRKWLSEGQNDALDRNVGRIGQALLWVTVAIWITGIINLNGGAAYSPPLSAQQARDLFQLPYGQPYTIALYVKIFTYGFMTLLAVPLVRAARRRAAEWEDETFYADVGAEAGSDAGVGAGAEGDLVGASSAAGGVAVATDTVQLARLGFLPRLSIASVIVGGVIIFVCVTALKYIHILSETVRGLL